MIEYLHWLTGCNGQNYRVIVKFTNLKQKGAISEGRADIEEIQFLIAKLSADGWEMAFDSYLGHVRNVQINSEKLEFKITADLASSN
jgi:hypothetical protein